jgi:hypothetical protein
MDLDRPANFNGRIDMRAGPKPSKARGEDFANEARC